MSTQEKYEDITSNLVDISIEDMRDGIQSFNLTELGNLKKSVELVYVRMEKIKNELLEKYPDMKYVDKLDANKVVGDIYVVLQNLEDKATLVEAVKRGKMDCKVLNMNS